MKFDDKHTTSQCVLRSLLPEEMTMKLNNQPEAIEPR
jgi:hypothetical protein